MLNNHGGARPGAGRPRKTSEFAYPEFTSAQIKKLSSSPYVYNIT